MIPIQLIQADLLENCGKSRVVANQFGPGDRAADKRQVGVDRHSPCNGFIGADAKRVPVGGCLVLQRSYQIGYRLHFVALKVL